LKRQVVLATVGSLGDLHPFIALGQALRAHGVRVTVACAAEYQSKVEKAGLEFRPVRPSFDDMQRTLGMDRTQLTRALLARTDFLFRRLIIPHLRAAYDDSMTALQGADLVLSSSLAFGARMAAERRGIPWIGIVLQPMLFLSAYDPPVMPNAEWISALLRRLGPTPTAGVLRLMKFLVGRLLAPVHALRREIGLAPTHRNPLFDGQFTTAGAIGLYSALLGAVRPDYPQPAAVVGFAFFDSDDGAAAALEPALSAFLDAGSAPLVFTLGSLIVNSPGSFYRESQAAARALGRRAVLLVGEHATADTAELRSADVYVCAYAPHSLLFPRAEVIVHQGGVGTLAQALRGGRPQLIVPFFADQWDNAARAVNLGVARSMAPARYHAGSAAADLAALMSGAAYVSRAAQVRAHLAGEHGAARAALIVLNQLESYTA
jgi:UDP:flavonoid glycosyltransferase YjiC (YdhE family)